MCSPARDLKQNYHAVSMYNNCLTRMLTWHNSGDTRWSWTLCKPLRLWSAHGGLRRMLCRGKVIAETAEQEDIVYAHIGEPGRTRFSNVRARPPLPACRTSERGLVRGARETPPCALTAVATRPRPPRACWHARGARARGPRATGTPESRIGGENLPTAARWGAAGEGRAHSLLSPSSPLVGLVAARAGGSSEPQSTSFDLTPSCSTGTQKSALLHTQREVADLAENRVSRWVEGDSAIPPTSVAAHSPASQKRSVPRLCERAAARRLVSKQGFLARR